MKTKNIIIVFVVLAVIIIVVFVIIKKLKDAGQNLVANTPLGSLAGVRSVEAQKAYDKLMSLKFMNHAWMVKANRKYNTSSYQIPVYLTTQQATDYARDLIDSKSIVSTDWTNDNARALATLMSAQNQVEIGQITDAYYNTNHKDLNKGLAWMSNEALITAADYLSNLPTGIYQSHIQLTNLTV